MEWGFFRVEPKAAETSMVLVLAPGVVNGDPVYGIDPHEGRFHSAASPPDVFARDQKIPQAPLWSVDQNIRGTGNRVIPVWGIVHRCGEANQCAAASLLRKHWAYVDGAVLQRVRQCSLPSHMLAKLQHLRVWPTSATVDISSSADVNSPSPADAVCVLSSSELEAAEGRCGGSRPSPDPPRVQPVEKQHAGGTVAAACRPIDVPEDKTRWRDYLMAVYHESDATAVEGANLSSFTWFYKRAGNPLTANIATNKPEPDATMCLMHWDYPAECNEPRGTASAGCMKAHAMADGMAWVGTPNLRGGCPKFGGGGE